MTIHRVTAPTWPEVCDQLDALTARLDEDRISYRIHADAPAKTAIVTELSPAAAYLTEAAKRRNGV